MVPPANIKVRAKMVFVLSEINLATGKEIRQSTVSYDITDTLTTVEVDQMFSQFETGKLMPELN